MMSDTYNADQRRRWVVYDRIERERKRQGEIGRDGSDAHWRAETWLAILVAEFAELADDIKTGKFSIGDEMCSDELVQVAAVAVAWLEQGVPYETPPD